ncbi:MAG: hypothetical protein DRP01_04225 [Archaeoglobales archaeon]|nr:MAG: hypothetical protein DRP01_04225 [Archaeoglobales archaeon]
MLLLFQKLSFADTTSHNTTSGDWQDAYTFTFEAPRDCVAIILAAANGFGSGSNPYGYARLNLDGSVITEERYYRAVAGTDSDAFTLFSFQTALAAGSHTLKMQYRAAGDGSTVYIDDCKIEILLIYQ